MYGEAKELQVTLGSKVIWTKMSEMNSTRRMEAGGQEDAELEIERIIHNIRIRH